MNTRLRWLAPHLLLAALLAAPGSIAQDAERVSLRLQDADIQELIRWGADHIDRNIILHPDVRGRVTVLAGEPLTVEEAYSVFVSILEVHGYAVTEEGDVVKVLPAQLATRQYAPRREGREGPRDDLDTRVLPLKHLSPAQAESLLTPLLTGSALVRTIPDSNLILLADRVGTLDRAIELVSQIDKPNPHEVRVVPLRHAKAETLSGHLRALLPQLFRDGQSGAGLIMRPDPRTNTLLLAGPPLHAEQGHELILQLDQPSPGESATRVVPIEYLPAGELVEPLRQLSQGLDAGESREKVVISQNETHNALIITAPERLFRQMEGLIEQLDISRAQVLVEAAIVEISADDALDIGIDWRWLDEGDRFDFSASSRGRLPTPEQPAFGAGLTYGYYYNSEFWSLVRALATDTDSDLLSTPTIVSLDNQSAEILVGENVPFVTGSATSSATPVSNPFQTIERQDIGVSLKIKPRINNANSITLEISQSVEQVAPTAAADAADIVTTKREINTTVLIEDGEILVLGGLIRDDVTEIYNKVPLLGDIPLLGRAFRSKQLDTRKRNLMVFIHPRILRHRDDKALVTERYLDRLTRLRDSGSVPLLFPSLDGDDDNKGEAATGSGRASGPGEATADAQDGEQGGAADDSEEAAAETADEPDAR